MIDLLRTLVVVFRTQVTRVLRTRRTLMMLLLVMMPAAIIVLSGTASREGLRERLTSITSEVVWHVLLQVVVPLVALLGGAAVVAEEIADRTIVYVVTRPVSRAGFFLGRWLAAALAVSVILGLGVAALVLAARFLGVELAPGFFPTVLEVTLLGGVVYCGLFAALGTFLKHPMIVGLGYTFAMEGLLANLPGESQGLAIQHHLRCVLIGFGGEAWSEVGRGSALIRYGPAPEAVSTLLITLAVSLLLASLIIRRKQYVLAS